MGLSKASIIDCLRESYGETVTSAEIKAFCQMNDFNYQTITNKLTDFKVGRGKWNLEVTKETVQELEVTYNVQQCSVEQNLIPRKMIPSSSLAILVILKKLFSPVYSTLRLSRVSRVMVKRFLSNSVATRRELIRVNITIETDEDDLIAVSVLLMTTACQTAVMKPRTRSSCSLTRSTLL